MDPDGNLYLHSETDLPCHGWLQGCRRCEIITSHTMVIRNEGKTIRMACHLSLRPNKCLAYLCLPCQRVTATNGDKKREFAASCEMDIQELESEYFDLFAC